MKENLLSEWNELQKTPVAWGQTDKTIDRANAEIRILTGLQKLGEILMPDGLVIKELIQERRLIIHEIQSLV